VNTARKLASAAAACLLVLPLGAQTPAKEDPAGRVTVAERVAGEGQQSEAAAFRVVQVVGNLRHPWGMAWLPDGRMLITERPGNLLLVDLQQKSVTALEGLPRIAAEQDQKTAPEGGRQGGLLDVVVHPGYKENRWIYFTYSSPGDRDAYPAERYITGTAVSRARLSEDGKRLVDLEPLYAQTPRHIHGRHYGSRIVFPGDGNLIFSIGDRGLRWPSQDLTDPAGSTIRIREGGGVPEDNPFVGKAPGNLRPEIWSFGHRNSQALALHPRTGDLWSAEHGPRGGDVLHVVEAGKNYGWPVVTPGVEYTTGEKIGVGERAPGIVPPVHVWRRSIAPSGMAFYTGERFPGWRGNLFVGSLVQSQLQRLVVEGRTVKHEEVLLKDVVGRIRDVRQGPDGYLYVLTDQRDGGVYRLEPVK
jgi:glucose/arabinose dehydrogenase